MIKSPYAPYYDVLVAHCINGSGYFYDGLWGKPHTSWCAPLAPNCTYMFSTYEMFVAAKNWLVKHLLSSVLRQAWNALRWFLIWNYDSLSGCHVAACFHGILLPYVADVCILMGGFVWIVGLDMKMPIGNMILPFSHVVYFRRNNGHTMISMSLLS